MNITEVTRRDIIDYLIARKQPFHGRLDLLDFLRKIWDLSSMPSRYSGFKDAEGDIWQHMINNFDWDDHYLLYDYLDLLGCDDETFLKFLETCIHPVVLNDVKQVSEMSAQFNRSLAPDGYFLKMASTISGKPIYQAAKLDVAEFEWDAFIIHATEDKESFVRELANRLGDNGIDVWYDEFTLRVGDSLRESIDKGLLKSRYGIAVLSPSFFAKDWPQRELSALLARDSRNQKVILPVWLDVGLADVARYSPLLADLVAVKAADGMDRVVSDLMRVLRPDSGAET